MSINRVTLMGHLGGDPEIKTLTSGRVCNLSIATNRKWKDKGTGEMREAVQWHRVVVWPDGLIGLIEKYVRKGDQIYIEGELQHRKYQDQSGQDRYMTEVVLQGYGATIQLCGGRREGGQSGGGYSGGGAPAESQRSQFELDDDIPF